VVIGLGEQSGQQVNMGLHPGPTLNIAAIDPVPGEILHQDGGNGRPFCRQNPQRRDVAQHQTAPGEEGRRLFDPLGAQRVEVVQGFQGGGQIFVENTPLRQADIGLQGVDGMGGGQRLRKQPRRHRGHNLETHVLPFGEGLHHRNGPGGMAKTMATDATADPHNVAACFAHGSPLLR
jgi:hypothetical protein